MNCMIIEGEITDEECLLITKESYLAKNSKKLPNKCKRIIGWKGICKGCKYHKTNMPDFLKKE